MSKNLIIETIGYIGVVLIIAAKALIALSLVSLLQFFIVDAIGAALVVYYCAAVKNRPVFYLNLCMLLFDMAGIYNLTVLQG